MDFPKNNNVRYAMIGNNSTNGSQPDGTLAVPSNISDGDLLVVDGDNNILSNAGSTRAFSAVAADEPIRICQYSSTGKHLFSPSFTKGTTTIPAQDTDAVAAVQQVSTIGFDGTSGALPVANDTNFFLKIRKNDNDAANRSQPTALWGQFRTDASGTQFELAVGLVGNLQKNIEAEVEPYVFADLLADDNGSANTGAGTVTVAAGGTTVTFGTDVDANVSVGDYIRIDESVGGSPDDTDPWYRIVSIDTGTESLTIDRPYAGTAAVSGAAQGNVVYATAGTLGSVASGIRLTGRPSAFDVDRYRNYFVNRFTPTFSNAATPVALKTAAKSGVGTPEQVAIEEYMSYGNMGENQLLSVPPVKRTQKVDLSAIGYNSLALVSNAEVQGLTGYNKERSVIMCYGENASSIGTVTNTSFAWLVATLNS